MRKTGKYKVNEEKENWGSYVWRKHIMLGRVYPNCREEPMMAMMARVGAGGEEVRDDGNEEDQDTNVIRNISLMV